MKTWSSIRKLPVQSVLLLLFIAFLIYRRAPDAIRHFQQEGTLFPVQKLMLMDGSVVEYPSAVGKSTVALFWTTWCGPCKLEMERIQKSINSGKIDSDRIYAIHIGGDVRSVSEHMKKHNFSFRALLDTDGSVASHFEISSTPSLFLVTSEQKIEWASSGLGLSDIWRVEEFLSN